MLQRLSLYKLRAKVEIEQTDLQVRRGTGDMPEGAFADPRARRLGWRLYGDEGGDDGSDFDRIRVATLVPEWGTELNDDTFILEAGFDRLHGVDFRKGCYVGQEVTARMKHKTELRKGFARVRVEGEAPVGTEIEAGGKVAGRLFTQSGGEGIAYLRYDRAGDDMQAGHRAAGNAGTDLIAASGSGRSFPARPVLVASPVRSGETMTEYEYRVVPAPKRGLKARGVKGTEARFANAIQAQMNDMAGDGWEFLRSETLPSEERSGLTSSHTVWRTLMIFRRPVPDAEAVPETHRLAAPATPVAEDAPAATPAPGAAVAPAGPEASPAAPAPVSDPVAETEPAPESPAPSRGELASQAVSESPLPEGGVSAGVTARESEDTAPPAGVTARAAEGSATPQTPAPPAPKPASPEETRPEPALRRTPETPAPETTRGAAGTDAWSSPLVSDGGAAKPPTPAGGQAWNTPLTGSEPDDGRAQEHDVPDFLRELRNPDRK